MNKKELVEVFEKIAQLLEIKGENPFKIRAYVNGARIIEVFDDDLQQYIDENKLEEIKGIGKAIAEKIKEFNDTGSINYYDKLVDTIPDGLFEILKIPGLGPKKVKSLYKKLGIKNIGELEYFCRENRLVDLDGFSSKTQDNILKGIANIKKHKGKYLFSEVDEQASIIMNQLSLSKNVIRYEVGGSLRRKKETVKDIDIVASSDNPLELIEEFVAFSNIDEIIAKGETKVSVRLISGINLDLRVVSDLEYPYTLNHFTGSKEHNTAIRHRAKELGVKVNEYGLFRGEDIILCTDENDIYSKLNLTYIPPELRENRGEIEASDKNILPKLIKISDIKGTFHMHTHYSDGSNSIEEMALAARNMGLEYIGISDHSVAAYYAGGMKVADVKKQLEEINRINLSIKDFKIFKGIEVDILPDGSLDYNDEILSLFDFVIASVHSNFNMSKEDMTDRIIKALENKNTTILGHLTGRLLLAREPYELDVYSIIDIAGKLNKIIEINCQPQRLDLDWRYLKYAKEKGVKVSINTDAHKIKGLENIKYGIGIARKGWMEKEDVINCLSKEEIDTFLKGVKNVEQKVLKV